jgi:hypothetical protein
MSVIPNKCRNYGRKASNGAAGQPRLCPETHVYQWLERFIRNVNLRALVIEPGLRRV